MDWKEKTLKLLRETAFVEAVAGRDDQFLVSVMKDEGVLRTFVRLDAANEMIHYENGFLHNVSTVPQLISSMDEHLDVELA